MARDLLSFFLPFPLWLIACKCGLPCRRLLFFLIVSLCIYRYEKQQRRRKAADTFPCALSIHPNIFDSTKFLFLGAIFLIFTPVLMSIAHFGQNTERGIYYYFLKVFYSTLHAWSAAPQISLCRIILILNQGICIVALAIRRSITTRLDLIQNEDEI
jgi:hypothetical protein